MVVTRFTVFQTRGGAIVDETEPIGWDWSEISNEAETVNLTLVHGIGSWQSLYVPWKHSIAVEVGNRVLGGPIIPSRFKGNERYLTVTARGYRSMLDRFPILPVAAKASPDAIAPGGVPNKALDTIISGFDQGTIGKKIIQQLMEWPGWTDSPIEFHPDRPGTHMQTYSAADRKSINSALSDLSAQQNGPDIRARLRRTGPDTFGWVYESGTETQPRLQGETVWEWEPTDLSGFDVDVDPSRMGSMAWSEGGRTIDQTLVRSAYDSFLVDRGFPLLHLESGMSSTASDPGTFDSWNAETLRTARKPWDFWQFEVPTDASPFPWEYNTGDLARVTLSPRLQYRAGILSGPDLLSGPGLLSAPFTEEALPDYLPSKAYTRRIVGIAGSSRTDEITITCGENYG